MPQSPTILFKPVNPKLFTCSALPFPAEDMTHVVGGALSVTAASHPPWCFPRSSPPPCTSGRTGSSELEARVLVSRLHFRSLGSHMLTAFLHARADRPGAPVRNTQAPACAAGPSVPKVMPVRCSVAPSPVGRLPRWFR